jgi:outer membrane receptor protein involved in Fe transport
MVRNLIHIAICCLVFPIMAIGQQTSLQGKVYDIKTGEALVGVTVTYGKNFGTVTDSEGNFQLNCHIGKIEFTFRLFGYKTQLLTLEIRDQDVNILNIGLEPYLNELEEVVISPDKIEKRVSELSVSMIVIKPFELTKKHIINAEEAINQAQGIEIMDGQASIRGGSGFSYGAGSRVLALIDGMPAIAPDAGNIRWHFLPIENLAQIEIIKGASSVLYGSSALNGVINLRTAPADTVPLILFSVLAGIFDKPANKDWVWWETPRLYSNVSFTYSKRFKDTEFGIGGNFATDNGYRRLNSENPGRVNLKVKHHSAKFPGLSYGVGFMFGYNNKQDFILWENATTGALKQDTSTAIELNALFGTFDPFISYKSKNGSMHELKGRFQVSSNRFPDNKANNSQAISDFFEYQYFNQFFDKLNVIAGISQFWSKITSEFYGNHTGHNVSVYTQMEYSPVKKLKLSGGIRGEANFQDGVFDKIVPVFRTGLNLHLARATYVRASFGQGYRYPSIAEKFAYTTLGAVKIYPNPEIRPEKGWSTEIGLKQGAKLGNWFGQADLAVFYSQNTDMVEYVFGLYPDPYTQLIDFGFRSSNIENSRVYGAETEFVLTRRYGKVNTTIGGGYTFIYPHEFNKVSGASTEEYLKYRRKHDARLMAGILYRKLEIGANAYFKSKTLRIDDVFLAPLTRERLLPGFFEYWGEKNKAVFLADVFVAYRLGKSIKLSFSVKNLGNSEYMSRPGDVQPHRSYSLQVSGRF